MNSATIINVDTVHFLDLASLAQVEISSEAEAKPIESALLEDSTTAWQAGESGEQTLRLIFDLPQTIKLIILQFDENAIARTQEFVLRWRRDDEDVFREMVHQQYNFSPPETNQEISRIVLFN